MLPCHGYPELKKYPHFYGHYGTAWQNQAKEFDKFPGAILLTLLYPGVKDIRLGPTLPAFVSPNVLNVLVEKFNIMPIKTPEEDLKAILG